jgi:uncharacterized membrane protein
MRPEFSHPQYLLLLPVLATFFWWVQRRSLASLDRGRAWAALIVRWLLLLLVVGAVSGFRLVHPTKRLVTIFIADRSDSVPSAQRKVEDDYIKAAAKGLKIGDGLGVIAFGADAVLDQLPDDTQAFTKIIALPNGARTNIAGAIQLAMACFPADAGKQIILFSDGNENLGNARELAEQASGNDVHISVVTLTRDKGHGEALLTRMDAPPQANQGQPFSLTLLAESEKDTDAVVTLYRDSRKLETRRVRLATGKTPIVFEQSYGTDGLYQYKAILDVPSDADTVPDNNVAIASVRISGKPHVLIVANDPLEGHYLAKSLQASDLAVEVGGTNRVPATVEGCAQYDAIYLVNIPAAELSAVQMACLRSAVFHTGMGLAMIGGSTSFGAGGYVDTPVEEALPVSMKVKKSISFPPVAIAMIIEDLELQVIVNTSIEAAKTSVDLLEQEDYVGVLDCSGGYGNTPNGEWRIPMQRVQDRNAIKRQLDALNGMGDPPLYDNYLKQAGDALAKTPCAVKHIILIGDGDAMDWTNSGPKPSSSTVKIANQLRARGISVSTIATGIDGPIAAAFMKQIANAGNGRFFEAKKPEDLPSLMLRDQQSICKPPIVEKLFYPVVANNTHPIMRGLPLDATPALQGYNVTSEKASVLASILMKTPFGEPLLAAQPFGLGRSLAFTSDAAAHWGALWVNWPGYTPFWAQALRWTLRQAGKSDVQASLTINNGKVNIDVEAITREGDFRNLLDLNAHVVHVSPDGYSGAKTDERTVPLQQDAPGHYTGSFDALSTGSYLVAIEERDGEQAKKISLLSIAIPYSPELQALHANTPLLDDIAAVAHGVVNPAPLDIYGKLRFTAKTLQDLWMTVLWIAALLFFVDIALRRVLLPWSEIFALLGSGLRRLVPDGAGASAPRSVVHAPTQGRLLDARGRARDGQRGSDALRDFRVQTPTPPAPPPDAPPVETAPPPEAPKPDLPTSTAGALLRKKKEREK